MSKTYQSMQEVFAETQDPAAKKWLGLNIKMLLVKYRSPAIWEEIQAEEKKRDQEST